MRHFLTTSMKNGVVDPFHEILWEQQAKLIRTKSVENVIIRKRVGLYFHLK